MEKLLQWAVNNSDQNSLSEQAAAIRRGEAQPDPTKYDPKILEAILGKDDATRMKESVECINNPEDTVDNKVIALDNLEMLIEGIDNARNIENMKLWPDIIKQLSASEPEVRKGTAWVCGTAVQNNPEAQKAFLDNQGLVPLVELLKDQDGSVRSKAIYAISCFLKHNPAGVQTFEQLEGLSVLQTLLKQLDDTTALRKIVFLYNSLIFENDSVLQYAVKNNTLQDLDAILVKYTQKETEDEDMVEKTLRTLHTFVTKSGLSVSDPLKQHIQDARTQFGLENLALTESEYQEMVSSKQ